MTLFKQIYRCLLLSLTAVTLSASAIAEQSDVQGLETEPCYVKGFADRMQCGTALRPLIAGQPISEDNQIEIHFAVIPAIKPSHQDEAVLVFAGGPGQGAIEHAGLFAKSLSSLRETRDLLLVDQRGTGRSQRLDCESEALADVFSYDPREIDEDKLLQQEASKCVEQLNTNLSGFSTTAAAADFEHIRTGLNYQGLHLLGFSYGTLIAQEYSRQFPLSVRSSILDGVVPLQRSLAYIGFAIDDAMQAVFDECAVDQTCANTHQDLATKLDTLVQRLRTEPVSVEIRHPRSNKPITMVVNHQKLLGTLRMALYSHITRALIPLVISEVSEQNYSTLVGLLSDSDMMDSIAMGMHNAVVCAESWPITTAADRAQLEQSYSAKEMLKSWDKICPIWDVVPAGDNFSTPLENDIPTLLLSGGLDPATPPSWAELAMVNMANARHLIAPSATHNVIAQTCAAKLVRQFVDTLDSESIDASCLETDNRKPFFMNTNGVVATTTGTED